MRRLWPAAAAAWAAGGHPADSPLLKGAESSAIALPDAGGTGRLRRFQTRNRGFAEALPPCARASLTRQAPEPGTGTAGCDSSKNSKEPDLSLLSRSGWRASPDKALLWRPTPPGLGDERTPISRYTVGWKGRLPYPSCPSSLEEVLTPPNGVLSGRGAEGKL